MLRFMICLCVKCPGAWAQGIAFWRHLGAVRCEASLAVCAADHQLVGFLLGARRGEASLATGSSAIEGSAQLGRRLPALLDAFERVKAAFERVRRSSTISAFSSGIGGSLVLETAGACLGLPAAGACLGTPAFTTLTIFPMFQLKLRLRLYPLT